MITLMIFLLRDIDLFWTKSSKRVFLILLGILILIIGSVLLIKGFDKEVNKLPLLFLPYFLFIMYILNRGTVVSQAMFMKL